MTGWLYFTKVGLGAQGWASGCKTFTHRHWAGSERKAVGMGSGQDAVAAGAHLPRQNLSHETCRSCAEAILL